MTSVPKPLKFLSPHYEKLKTHFDSLAEGDFKVSFFSPFLYSIIG